MAQPRIPGKFYPLTPEMMRRLRQADLSRHEMNLWLYLTELDPYGDRYQELPSAIQIMSELEMSKATYFRSKARLQELKLYDFQEDKVSFRNLTGVSKMRLESQKCDSESHERDLQSHERDSESHERDLEPSKPAPSKGSGTPQTYSEYSDFLQTLSEAERENFLELGKKKAELLPKAPQLPERWIEKNWEELRSQWLAQLSPAQKPAAEQERWANDPRREEWIAEIRIGKPRWIAQGDQSLSRDERKAFAEWAESQNLIWGAES